MLKKVLIAVVFSIALQFGYVSAADSSTISIIPKPVAMEVGEGCFVLTAKTKIIVSKETSDVGQFLAEKLSPATGYGLKVKKPGLFQSKKNTVILKINSKLSDLGDEGYKLTVSQKGILIEAPKAAGVFYGCQSLLQLLPPAIMSSQSVDGIEWSVPAVEITDKPRFQWRGLHMDVCRHYMPKEFVLKYIDLLALHKMNTLHWHLTEDQGWRIEIKKYPKLTEIGSKRKETIVGHGGSSRTFDGIEHSGFYTQQDVKEIVAYAKKRFITVVPEIEMPGHAQAAISAYPEYACTEGPFEVWTKWGVSDNVYCAGNEATYIFLENVLDEVLELFPSKFIHVGGDECPKTKWKKCPKCQAKIKQEGLHNEHELQSHLIKHFDKYLTSKGRRLIGWDEILEGGLAPGAAVMSWRGESGGIKAAKAGHDVTMAPNSHTYFDHYQGDPKSEPLAIGGFLPLKKVYSYDPIPEALTEEEAKHILGAQGQLWSEYIPTPEHMEYMAYPRGAALAEVVWSQKDARNWDDFVGRLATHLNRLDTYGVNFRVPEPAGLEQNRSFSKDMTVELKVPFAGARVRYTLDGTEPTEDSPVYTDPIKLTKNTVTTARTFMANGKTSVAARGTYRKVTPKDPVKVDKTEPGVSYRYFEGSYKSVPDFSKLTPAKTGVQESFGIPGGGSGNFAVELAGYIKIPMFGLYTFYTTSDDGSRLWVAGELVVDNDGLHSSSEKSGQILLKPGLHPIKVGYFEAGGAKVLKVGYQGIGAKKKAVPANMLVH